MRLDDCFGITLLMSWYAEGLGYGVENTYQDYVLCFMVNAVLGF